MRVHLYYANYFLLVFYYYFFYDIFNVRQQAVFLHYVVCFGNNVMWEEGAEP